MPLSAMAAISPSAATKEVLHLRTPYRDGRLVQSLSKDLAGGARHTIAPRTTTKNAVRCAPAAWRARRLVPAPALPGSGSNGRRRIKSALSARLPRAPAKLFDCVQTIAAIGQASQKAGSTIAAAYPAWGSSLRSGPISGGISIQLPDHAEFIRLAPPLHDLAVLDAVDRDAG